MMNKCHAPECSGLHKSCFAAWPSLDRQDRFSTEHESLTARLGGRNLIALAVIVCPWSDPASINRLAESTLPRSFDLRQR